MATVSPGLQVPKQKPPRSKVVEYLAVAWDAAPPGLTSWLLIAATGGFFVGQLVARGLHFPLGLTEQPLTLAQVSSVGSAVALLAALICAVTYLVSYSRIREDRALMAAAIRDHGNQRDAARLATEAIAYAARATHPTSEMPDKDL